MSHARAPTIGLFTDWISHGCAALVRRRPWASRAHGTSSSRAVGQGAPGPRTIGAHHLGPPRPGKGVRRLVSGARIAQRARSRCHPRRDECDSVPPWARCRWRVQAVGWPASLLPVHNGFHGGFARGARAVGRITVSRLRCRPRGNPGETERRPGWTLVQVWPAAAERSCQGRRSVADSGR